MRTSCQCRRVWGARFILQEEIYSSIEYAGVHQLQLTFHMANLEVTSSFLLIDDVTNQVRATHVATAGRRVFCLIYQKWRLIEVIEGSWMGEVLELIDERCQEFG